MVNSAIEHSSRHNAVDIGKTVYRYMVVGAAMLPIICISMVTLFAFVVILYVFGSFVVVALE